MIYLVDGEAVSFDEFRDKLEDAIRSNVEENYDDMLDELYEPYQIGCCTFYASQVLRECDPIAYNMGIDDFINADLEDALYNFENEHTEAISGVDFETQEEAEEELDPTYQVWVLEEDADGSLLEDHGNYMKEFDNSEDAQDYFEKIEADEVKKFIVDQGYVVKKEANYRVVIETVIQDGPDSETNVDDVDSRIFIF